VSGSLKGYKPDSARWPVLRHGLIFFKGASTICFVLNRSRAGAGLVLQSDVPLPLTFDLEIDGENIRRRCVAVWRDQCRIGVSFDVDRTTQTSADDEPVEAPMARRPAVLAKERSLERLLSVLRFVELTNVYKSVALERAAGTQATPENPGVPARYKSSYG
jgi:hypothetical protein